jgi:hypothetical protein
MRIELYRGNLLCGHMHCIFVFTYMVTLVLDSMDIDNFFLCLFGFHLLSSYDFEMVTVTC